MAESPPSHLHNLRPITVSHIDLSHIVVVSVKSVEREPHKHEPISKNSMATLTGQSCLRPPPCAEKQNYVSTFEIN